MVCFLQGSGLRVEQKVPYDVNYTGAIRPTNLKESFLAILDNIEKGADSSKYLSYIFQSLIIQRNLQQIDLAKPTNLSIDSILGLLENHFGFKYKAEGASRLPVLAVYSCYLCLLKEVKRFELKTLLELESHTSSDARSGRISDIDILDENNRAFKAIEVKYKIPITLQLVQDSYRKFQTTPVNRYYIVSTSEINGEEYIKIQAEILRIKNVHGCQLIVDDVISFLEYNLRLLRNTYDFIERYVELIEKDTALKFEHKERWNALIGALH